MIFAYINGLVEVASVRTATLAEDGLRFVATKDVMPGDARGGLGEFLNGMDNVGKRWFLSDH